MKHRFIAKRYWNDVPNAFSAEKESRIDDLINLTYGDPDFTTAETILAPTFADIRNGHTHYDELCGYLELRRLIVSSLKEDYDIVAEIPEIYVTNGAGHGLMIALESIIDDGDEIIIHEPYYSPYIDQIKMARGIPVVVETREEEGFDLNPARLEAKISARTRAVIINTPNNPTGATFSRQALEGIAAIAKKHDLIVICDMAYATFNYQGKYLPICTLDGMQERTITLCSASKEYAMTGWRVGFNYAPDFLIERMKRVNENDTIMASSVAQRAYIHAIINRQEIHKELVDIFCRRVRYVYERIAGLKHMHALEPKATFYLFPSIRETGLTSDQVVDILYREAHVAVFPGTAFGMSGEGYIRIACTQNMELLQEAFDRIEKLKTFQ